MSFEEKLTWVTTAATIAVAAVYAWIIGQQVATVPVTEIVYQKTLLISVGALVGLIIIGAIITAIVSAVGVEITGEGSVDDIDRRDERDIDINQRGELAGYYVTSTLILGVLAMAMLELPYFWIANAIFATVLVSGLISNVFKLVSYRRGL